MKAYILLGIQTLEYLDLKFKAKKYGKQAILSASFSNNCNVSGLKVLYVALRDRYPLG